MISSKIHEEIVANCQSAFSCLNSPGFDFERMAAEFVSVARAEEELRRLEDLLGQTLSGKRMLEVGSGYGMVIAIGRRSFGIETFGIEPGEQFCGVYETSLKILDELNIPSEAVLKGAGENIPFDDDHFDIVYSSNVLEHVRNPQMVLQESVRVLKPGGYLVYIIPNYGSWWEGHYGTVFLPYVGRAINKLMLRLSGRDPSMLDTLQFITYRKLVNWIKGMREHVECIGFGQDVWERRLKTLNFSEWASLGRLKKVVSLIHKLKIVNCVLWFGKWLHWETPFILIMRKK